MNPGVVDEAGKAAQSTIEALKSTPVVLALVLFNILYMGSAVYTQIRQSDTYDRAAERWKGLTETAMRYCNLQPQAQLLHPGKKWVLQSEESHPVELPPQSEESEPVELPPLPQPRPPEADK